MPTVRSKVGAVQWAISDEGRTFERFRRFKDRFFLVDQYELDGFFPDLPKGEADLEAIDLQDSSLWLCGSHSSLLTHDKAKTELEKKPSRRLIGTVVLSDKGQPSNRAFSLPFQGRDSLRHILGSHPLLSSSLALPCKGGGLDIEGMAVWDDVICFGLRGPLVNGLAVLAYVGRNGPLRLPSGMPTLVLLDLGGLGIRDLCRCGGSLLILAGPTMDADEPFKIYRRSFGAGGVSSLQLLHGFEDGVEHPEGLALFPGPESAGLLVFYDKPSKKRVSGNSVWADWLELPSGR
ncbi:DUF3616 domain-containing protein [Rhizobium grahamii]|uniref:DUF3616 domain-containing protein n=1 Tax=Rhizobium grahamii TaxID=1120045 RepID=A0A370KF72_9HYPH|nr:DUF3616 domain-containing protein [Rhizobium grahamii]RDJ02980.1 hypothetical protein B5K06_31305 [Rhizobium grahamii]